MMRKKHSNSCVCPAKSGAQKEEEEDKVHQFLMGLNETYASVRSNLLMMNPLLSLDTAYNILLQDERQRQVNSVTQFHLESSSFNVNFNGKNPVHPNPPQRQYNQRVNFDQSKFNLFCKYCKKSGHLIDKCYKLHGFPQNFKFTKGRKMAANAIVDSISHRLRYGLTMLLL